MINILMIEDDAELAKILTIYLQQYNIKVTNYETPELGISALSLKKYDLIILDLSLPNIDGIEATRRIKDANLPCRVLIFTSRDNEDDVFACFKAGASFTPSPVIATTAPVL